MKNNILLRTLVRLTKKYHNYDILCKNITKEQIFENFKNDKLEKNSVRNFHSIFNNLMVINSKIFPLLENHFITEFNSLLYALSYPFLKEFLINNNIYGVFIKNLKYNCFNQDFNSFDDYINYIKRNNIDIRNFIIYSFTFRKTAEGHSFWINIHKKYVAYIIDLLIKDEEK